MSRDRLARLLDEYETWLTVERGASASTRAAYRRDLRRYATFLRAHGVDDPAAVGEALVNVYVDELRTARTDDGGPRYQPASIARMVVSVRSFHRFLVDDDQVEHDPAAEVGAPRVPQGIPKALTPSEVERLLGAVTGDDPRAQRDRALLELLYASGIRISELVGLDVRDLELPEFEPGMPGASGSLGFARVLGKGDKERIVPIGRVAQGALGTYLHAGRPALLRPGARATSALFLNARGGRLTRQGAWGVVRGAGARVGLADRLSPHVLRHSCATHLVEGGADIRVVQELLGHARISTTQVYTKVSPERLRQVYDDAHPRARRAG